MTLEMFDAPGRLYRGNLHTHSTRPDGVLAPEEVCRRYRAEGYDFIALTDHFIGLFDFPITNTTGFRKGGFTTLLGAELHSGAMENGELWHILAVGLPTEFEPPNAPHFRPVEDQESGGELARRAREAGAFVVIAHPEWSGLTTADAQSIEAAHAVEVYNHGCATGCDRPHGFYTLDRLLEGGRRLNLCATDDAHFADLDHFGGWVMVRATDNEPDAFLAVLKDGHYYSSQGPDFSRISVDRRTLTVQCSSVVSVIPQGRGSASVAVHGASMTRAELPLERFAALGWVRVTLFDAAGRRTWSNPIWLES